jgi:hypothetical protein
MWFPYSVPQTQVPIMQKSDRETLLDILSQVEQLSVTAQQLIKATNTDDVYNEADQLRGYMKVMREKLDVALEHVGPET